MFSDKKSRPGMETRTNQNKISEGTHLVGDIKSKGNSSWLQWSHSYSKVYPWLRDKKYSFRHPFIQFGEFDVENRQRVKCVSASEGVPVSTQWDKKGYYYSILSFKVGVIKIFYIEKGYKNNFTDVFHYFLKCFLFHHTQRKKRVGVGAVCSVKTRMLYPRRLIVKKCK